MYDPSRQTSHVYEDTFVDCEIRFPLHLQSDMFVEPVFSVYVLKGHFTQLSGPMACLLEEYVLRGQLIQEEILLSDKSILTYWPGKQGVMQ
jgi:hypothetical protein